MCRTVLPYSVLVEYEDETNQTRKVWFDSFSESDETLRLVTRYKEEYFLYRGCLNDSLAHLEASTPLDEDLYEGSLVNCFRVLNSKHWTLFFDPEEECFYFDSVDLKKVDKFETRDFEVSCKAGEGKPAVHITLT